MLHIYTERFQPATAWKDTHSGGPIAMGFAPSCRLVAHCCRQRRRAARCVVQSFYDGLSIWCAEGYGCKHPRVIAARKWREHMNRSRAQRARRARERAARLIQAGVNDPVTKEVS